MKKRRRYNGIDPLLFTLLVALILPIAVHANEAHVEDDYDGGDDNPKVGDVLADGTILGAQGGTELMSEAFYERLPTVFHDRFSFTKSRVRELDPHKKNILWIHDLPDDPENQHLRYEESRGRFAKIVFVSEWQRQQFIEYYRTPFTDSVIMKNAIVPLPFGDQENRKRREGEPIRLIYHTTPHRGLALLLPVFFKLYELEKYKDRIRLDVYSSFKIYGWEFKDPPYLPLFESCKQHPGCHYHGIVPNSEIRKVLTQTHIFAYPAIWKETSCIAAIEAMSAGLEIVTNDLGALPETLGGFGMTYEYTEDVQGHMTKFAETLIKAIDTFWDRENIMKRKEQQIATARMYDWGFFGLGGRVEDWIQMLAMMEKDLFGVETPQREYYSSDANYAEALTVAGRIAELRGDTNRAIALYKPVYQLDKNNSHWLVAFGHALMLMGQSTGMGSSTSNKGVEMLEHAMTSQNVHPLISRDSAVMVHMGARLAFYYAQLYKDAQSFYWLDEVKASKYPHDDCWNIFQATQVPHLPGSPEEEIQRIQTYHSNVDSLLKQDYLLCRDANVIGSVFPVAYYELDFKDELEKFSKLLTHAFPWLLASSPDLEYDDVPTVDVKCAQGNVKIGVISSFMEPTSSIWGSFGMTLRYLQSHPFIDLALIYYPRQEILPEHQYLSLNPETNIYLHKMQRADPHALFRNREKIAEGKFDVLLYLDLFMTIELHQLAVAKLAPVQITTHGHPVTSGVSKEVMDYYLSWEAAELPDKEAAQRFYTEELVLIPGNVTWEYYEPRTTPDERSIAGKAPFGHYTRQNIDFIQSTRDRELLLSSNAVWYFCSQASFKFHIEFDKTLGKIQTLDPNAVIILIQQTGPLDELYQKTRKRFADLGTVDLDRVVFIPRLGHASLMAMYKLSDVTLDSFYFGGDTTTREAFEVGAPVITLPHKTIGQRWTQAYYNRMGITDYIAVDPDDYAQKAVQVGNLSESEKKRIRKRVKEAARSKLFHSHQGYPEWAKALIEIARRPRRWHWNDASRLPKERVEFKPLPAVVDSSHHTEL